MDGLMLLRDARRAGLAVEVRGDQLVVRGPRHLETLARELLARKPEVIAALSYEPPPVDRPDGCATHAVTPGDVARWWSVAEGRDATVSVCGCCLGPAPDQHLRCRRCETLAEYAARFAPAVRFTMRETDDVAGDVALLRRIHAVIAEHQPGENLVILTVKTLDGRRRSLGWRAVATPELRRGIARVLAARHTGGVEAVDHGR